LLAVSLDITGADIGVVRFERVDDIAHREMRRRKTVWPWRYMILTDITADRVDFSNARRRAQLRTNDPVLQRAQIFRRPFQTVRLSRAGLCFDDIHEDFAETGCNRPHFRFDAFRKLTARRLQALIN